MPSSPLIAIVGIMGAIYEIKPKSVLDIGVGFGKFGFLIRQYLDLRPGKKGGYAKWSIRLDGIEIHENYLTPVHDYIYNEIFIGNAINILSGENLYYDLILAVDVIEHFNKKDGLKFIKLCKGRSDFFIISTPYIFYKQGEEYDNIYETHLSGWDAEDFKSAGANYMWKHGISLVAVFAERELDLTNADDVQDDNFTQYELKKIRELASLYYDTSQFEECIRICEKHVPLFVDDYELLLLIALSYEKMNKIEKACEYAERTLELNNNVSMAIEILNRIQL